MIPQFVLMLISFCLHLCCLAGLFAIGLEYPGGRAVEYEYDALNRISDVFEAPSGGGRSLFAKYFYHGPGVRVARRDMIGNASEADPAVRLSASYDDAGRPLESSFTQRPASGANGLLELSFGWDASWSQSRRQASWAFGSAADLLERERTFTYDQADRLTGGALRAPQAGAPAGSGTPVAFSRGLDAAGNRDSDFVVGASNKYLRPQVTPSVDFIYDSNGNLLNEETAHESGGSDNSHDYYNWRNQLASHYHGAVQQFRYRYDALGRLISKRYNANADSRWAWDGWRAVEEKRQAGNSSWVTEATWVYGNGLDETLSMRRDALDGDGAPAAAGQGDGATANTDFIAADADFQRAMGLTPSEISTNPSKPVLQRPLLILIERAELHADRGARDNNPIYWQKAAEYYQYAIQRMGKWEQEVLASQPTPLPPWTPPAYFPRSFPPEWRLRMAQIMKNHVSGSAWSDELSNTIRDIDAHAQEEGPAAILQALRAVSAYDLGHILRARSDALKAWKLKYSTAAPPYPSTMCIVRNILGADHLVLKSHTSEITSCPPTPTPAPTSTPTPSPAP